MPTFPKSPTGTRVKTKTRPKTSKQALLPGLATSIPRLAIVGDFTSTQEIALIAKKMGINADRYKYIKDLKEGFTGREAGIVYVTPMERGEIISIHKNLKKDSRFREVPCFAITPEWVTNSKERKMYSAGIRMIFEWPKDRMTFSNLLSGIITVGTNKVKHLDEDKALSSAVGNRVIAKFGHFAPNIKYPCYNGIVMLRGNVRSLENKRQITKFVKRVPGVRGVLDVSLQVKPTKTTDRSMRARARKLLRLIPDLDSKAVKVEVKKSRLILNGNIPSKELHKQILNKMESLTGVKKIDNFLVISKKAYKKDSGLAQRASHIVKKASLTKSKNLRVKITNGSASLLGSVTHPMDKAHLESVLKSISGIKKVSNQLTLTSI